MLFKKLISYCSNWFSTLVSLYFVKSKTMSIWVDKTTYMFIYCFFGSSLVDLL